MKSFTNEYEGQRAFYEKVGINPEISHHTDGVDKGNLYENKLDIPNINKVLFQAIKYASRIRIRGEKLPANMILNDLNKECVYIYRTSDFLDDIEKVYFGAASKDNDEYKTEHKPITIDYSDSKGIQRLLEYVNSEDFVKYHVDASNIIGLSQQFYKTNSDKDTFIKGEIAEIRKPQILFDRILPYEKKSNIEFEDIMDCLNPNLLQREQGAYYTPKAYVDEMHKMLYRAIDEVPNGMDYVIIDRCAGTGNLEEGLPDEVLKHCVLSTIERNEYAILNYKYGDKCKVVIPETDALAFDVIPASHNLQGVTNDYVREQIENPNCVVILMENPPFSEAGSGGTQNTGKKDNLWKQSFVMTEMRKNQSGPVLNDLANLFIWSAFKYYLRKSTDSYILYSPTKYWRNQNLVNKAFVDGFFCNRKEFHAGQPSATACIWWRNMSDIQTKQLTLKPYDIQGDTVVPIQEKEYVTIRKAKHLLSEAYEKRDFEDKKNGILCESNGVEFKDDGRKKRVQPTYNDNIIAYLKADSFAIDRKHVSLTTMGYFKGDGFFMRKDNYLEKLPLFIASIFPCDKWYKIDVFSKSYDGKGNYLRDKEFLKRCLIYTVLSAKNKCRSLLGSDGRYYTNELCFDKKDTLAWKKYVELEQEGIGLSEQEKTLLKNWADVLYEAEKTEEYIHSNKIHPRFRYGLFQIKEEINVKIDSGRKNKKGAPVYIQKYSQLNTEIKKLEMTLKDYYTNDISPLLFKYELIK